MLQTHHSLALLQELSANARNQDIYQTISLLGAELSKDGNKWCYLLGENLQEGIAGFGDTAYEAAEAFHLAYHNESTKGPSNG